MLWVFFPVCLSTSTFDSKAECLSSLHGPTLLTCILEEAVVSLSSLFCASFSQGCGGTLRVHFKLMVSSLLTSCDCVTVPAGCVVAQPSKSPCSTLCSLISTHGYSLCSLTLKRWCKSFVVFSLRCKVVISFWNWYTSSL